MTFKKILIKPESGEREDGTSGIFESNSSFTNTQTRLVGWNVLQTDDIDVFGIDLTLFIQDNLSMLLLEALFPQMYSGTSCHALGHAIPLLLSCY